MSGISATCTMTGLAGVSWIAAVALRGSSVSGDTIRGEHSSEQRLRTGGGGQEALRT